MLDELSAHDQNPQARFLKDFLSTVTPALMRNGNQLFSQMMLYPPAVDRYKAILDAPPFPTLIPLVPKAGATEKFLENDTWKFDVVKRLNDDSNYAITVSTIRKEISVWDVHT